ncbi:MAG: hypothetical protein ABI837_08895 [Acidobacteriota bacterium]
MPHLEVMSDAASTLESPSRSRRGSGLLALATVAVTLVSASAIAQTALTGTWTGTYSYSIAPAGCNKTFASNGNVAVTFLQNTSVISGTMVLSDLQMFTGTCTTTRGDFPDVLSGILTGNAVSWSLLNDADFTEFIGVRNGDTISATITDVSGGSGTLTLNRTGGPAPAIDSSGSWSGSYNFTDRCSNGGVQNYSGSMKLGVLQAGPAYNGVLTMDNVPLYDRSCQKVASETLTLSTAGNVSSSTLSGAVFEPAGSFEFPLSITTDGTTMTGAVSGASQTSTTGTFTLTRSSSQRPDTGFTGTYQGSYTERDNVAPFCFNVATLSFGGAAAIAVTQAGNAVSGTLTLADQQTVVQDGFGGCGIVTVGEVTLPLFGTLSGGSLILVVPQGGGVANNYNVNFSSGSANGTITDSFGDLLTFSTTKATTVPQINTFSASPASIVAGQSATLSWTTSNATSVSIDGGVGTQPASGSITVTPNASTVYTLTATGAGGTATTQATITVNPVPPKRRVSHQAGTAGSVGWLSLGHLFVLNNLSAAQTPGGV